MEELKDGIVFAGERAGKARMMHRMSLGTVQSNSGGWLWLIFQHDTFSSTTLRACKRQM